MSRHFCPYTEENILCIAESRGDERDCDRCFKKDAEDERDFDMAQNERVKEFAKEDKEKFNEGFNQGIKKAEQIHKKLSDKHSSWGDYEREFKQKLRAELAEEKTK